MRRLPLHALVGLMAAGIVSSGCAAMWAGAGAAGATTAYEAKNKHDLDKLEERHNQGNIGDQEYGTRKDAIEDRSIIY